MDERLIADFACLDPIYTDGIAGYMNLGANFATLFFRWSPVRIEDGQIIFERAPALCLVRPRASITDRDYAAILEGQRAPSLDLRTMQ